MSVSIPALVISPSKLRDVWKLLGWQVQMFPQDIATRK